MGKDVIIALDFDSREKTLAFLDRFTEEKPFVKVGMELFYAEGPAIVREIRRRGHRIFLDLKLHDIPNTVKKAMAALSALDVDIANLHAAGTAAMMTGFFVTSRTARVTAAAVRGSAPKAAPPPWTLGQEMFTSSQPTCSAPSSCRHTWAYSSMEKPLTLAITGL